MALPNSTQDLFQEIKHLFSVIIAKDRRFIGLALVYGVAISLLSLAVPVSVQFLVNSVANTASIQAITILAMILFFLLLFSGMFHAIQTYVMELFERRIFARLSAEFTLRLIHTDYHAVESLNRNELVNRFFDIMSIQKIIPSLVIGMFALILQMVVGVVLVSFYHPWFLMFNICFILSVWLIWALWGKRAMQKAIEVSDAKYRTARHLEDVARAIGFFKSEKRRHFATAKTEALAADYLAKRKKYFRYSFSQHIAFLLLYAASSALLLGLGGWLVILGELTLGQLVAAELILSAVFYGVSRLGYSLVQCYDLGAALEEINRMYDLPRETGNERTINTTKAGALQFDNAIFQHPDQNICLNFTIEAGEHLLVHAAAYQLQEHIFKAVKSYRHPDRGTVKMAGIDLRETDYMLLRDKVIVLDKAEIIECSVRDYLSVGNAAASLPDMHLALQFVELEERIQHFPHGLDTMLGANGMPLSPTETLRLKIAGALLSKPDILVLNEYFDTLSFQRRQRIMQRLCSLEGITVLYFSNRLDLNCFDGYLYVGKEKQIRFDSVSQLRDLDQETGQ